MSILTLPQIFHGSSPTHSRSMICLYKGGTRDGFWIPFIISSFHILPVYSLPIWPFTYLGWPATYLFRSELSFSGWPFLDQKLGAREGREAAGDPKDGQQSGRERGSKATGWGGPVGRCKKPNFGKAKKGGPGGSGRWPRSTAQPNFGCDFFLGIWDGWNLKASMKAHGWNYFGKTMWWTVSDEIGISGV